MINILKGIGSKREAPARHTVIRDHYLAEKIYQEGFAVVDLIDQDTLKTLKELFFRHHQLNDGQQGGMFYSLYSQDLEYREMVHLEIKDVLKQVFDHWFRNYKNVINTFIVKTPGPKSEFNIHQDSTSMDESLHSPVSVWIPLQDVDETNGALCIIPRTHHFLSKYRGISFPSQIGNIQKILPEFLRPVFLKEGQAIIFDNRIIHSSMRNAGKEARLAIVAGIFPEEAPIVTCYSDETTYPYIEILEHPDNFLLTHLKFYHNCTDRPVTGKVIRTEKRVPQMSEKEFLRLCQQWGIEKISTPVVHDHVICNMISEPH